MRLLTLINIGVPMIFPALPVMLVSLLPVIFIEALVLRHFLTVSLLKATKAAGLANLASTFVGIPLTWFFLAALQMLTGGDRSYGLNTPLKRFLAVTWQAPWLTPYESRYALDDSNSGVGLARSILLCFLVRRVLRRGTNSKRRRSHQNQACSDVRESRFIRPISPVLSYRTRYI